MLTRRLNEALAIQGRFRETVLLLLYVISFYGFACSDNKTSASVVIILPYLISTLS
jgi:hypothetical protein